LHDPQLLGDLRYIFERSGFIVEQRGEDAVEVLAAAEMDPKLAEEDAKLLPMLWRATDPGVTAEPA
jgi:hypothetical protein